MSWEPDHTFDEQRRQTREGWRIPSQRLHMLWLFVGLTLGTGGGSMGTWWFMHQRQLRDYPPLEATIQPTEAVFVFPLQERPSWDWDALTTPPFATEYAWSISVPAAQQPYLIAFSVAKGQGDKPQPGSFGQLLATGRGVVAQQAAAQPTIFQGIDHVRVDVLPFSNRLLLRITERGVINRIFAERPPVVTFTWQTPYDGAATQTIPVIYRDT